MNRVDEEETVQNIKEGKEQCNYRRKKKISYNFRVKEYKKIHSL